MPNPRNVIYKRGIIMPNKNVFAGTGKSTNDDAYYAGRESVEAAILKMKAQGVDQGPDFGIVFCSGGKYGQDHNVIQALVKGAHEAFTNSNSKCQWIGCTSAGEISNKGFSKNSCVAFALTSKFIKF